MFSCSFHDHVGFVLSACFGVLLVIRCFRQKIFLCQSSPPGVESLCSCAATTPNNSGSFVVNFYDLHTAAFIGTFSKILVSIKELLKKQASQLLTCRGGLGDEATYNIYIYIYKYIHIFVYKYMFCFVVSPTRHGTNKSHDGHRVRWVGHRVPR